MDIISLVMSFVSLVVGWLISRHYYQRQTKEQINPIPYIQEVNTSVKEVNTNVLELHSMAMERQDAELQRGVKSLVMSLVFSRNRVLNSLVPPIMLLGMIDKILKADNKDQVEAQLTELKELEPIIKNAIRGLGEAGHEYDGLMETAEQISGKKFADMFTTEEVDQLLTNPQMSRNRKVIPNNPS